MAKQEFEFIVHICLTDMDAGTVGLLTEDKIKMKGEFSIEAVQALRNAVIADFVTRLDSKLNKAITGGYHLS